jgi:hypothetical protein
VHLELAVRQQFYYELILILYAWAAKRNYREKYNNMEGTDPEFIRGKWELK